MAANEKGTVMKFEVKGGDLEEQFEFANNQIRQGLYIADNGSRWIRFENHWLIELFNGSFKIAEVASCTRKVKYLPKGTSFTFIQE